MKNGNTENQDHKMTDFLFSVDKLKVNFHFSVDKLKTRNSFPPNLPVFRVWCKMFPLNDFPEGFMKKSVFILVFILIFAGCSSSKSVNSDDDSFKVENDVELPDTDSPAADDESQDNAQNDLDEIEKDSENIVEEENETDNDDEFQDVENIDEFDGEEQDEFEHDEEVDIDEQNDDDNAKDHVEILNNIDGSVTVNVTLNHEKDVVSSYLMDAGTSSWNYFYGDFVNIGFRVYDLLEDQYVAYHTAFRFTDVEVPAGATIEKAELSLHPTNEVDSSKRMYLRLAMEKTNNSSAFDTSNYSSGRPDQRTKTDAVVAEWLLRCQDIDDCYDPESSYCKQRALDCWDREVRYTVPKSLKEMAQEVIDIAGWTKGNAMTVFITGTYPSEMSNEEKPNYSNSRSVTGFDTEKTPSYYPVLSVTFTVK